jgi:peptidoglycan-associated lipoprotein
MQVTQKMLTKSHTGPISIGVDTNCRFVRIYKEGKVIMRTILVALAITVLAWGCGGGPPVDETTQSPTMSGNQGDESGGQPGDAERPDRGSVESQMDAMRGMKTIYFDFDKYNLRDDARNTLDRNAEILRANPDLKITIEGHCDERGTNEYNLALGENRAKAARDYLVRLGIDPSRISIISYGEERPVALGHDEAAWAQNRRGEFDVQ